MAESESTERRIKDLESQVETLTRACLNIQLEQSRDHTHQREDDAQLEARDVPEGLLDFLTGREGSDEVVRPTIWGWIGILRSRLEELERLSDISVDQQRDHRVDDQLVSSQTNQVMTRCSCGWESEPDEPSWSHQNWYAHMVGRLSGRDD